MRDLSKQLAARLEIIPPPETAHQWNNVPDNITSSFHFRNGTQITTINEGNSKILPPGVHIRILYTIGILNIEQRERTNIMGQLKYLAVLS